MKYQFKQIFVIILIVAMTGGVIWNIEHNKKNKKIATEVGNTEIEKNEPVSLCYYDGKKTDRNFYDVFWLKLNIDGEKVTGEYQSRPAEKDSKIGKFQGTVGQLNQNTMSRTADVWWQSLAEGMNVTEELVISFGDGSASVLMGEMYNRGDGVYVYKDKNVINYKQQMGQVDCEMLDEKFTVEKYIEDNISIIAINKAVLGGTWHVLSVSANPAGQNGEVKYEDGHIESTATFTYTYNKEKNVVIINSFKVTK